MLPNLRTVPVGGVFFAIVLFAPQLAFGQEQVSRTLVVPAAAPARGPLQVAALPDHRDHANADETTGSIAESPDATLPVDIGETSSTELPINNTPEQPPVTRMPQQIMSPRQPRGRAAGQ
jgi:hypothetical protein